MCTDCLSDSLYVLSVQYCSLHQLQYSIVTDEDLRGWNILHSIYLCYVIAQELPGPIYAVAMSLEIYQNTEIWAWNSHKKVWTAI